MKTELTEYSFLRFFRMLELLLVRRRRNPEELAILEMELLEGRHMIS